MRDGNFKLYKASAGTGKTYTLVKEFLTLCLSYKIPIFNNILAVTFTNKAANEMKAKILDYLNGIMTDHKDYQDMKNELINNIKIDEVELERRASELYDSILHNYSDLNVSTIDSFVQQISRTFASELKLPNQYRVLLDDDDLIDELIQRIDKEIGNNDNELSKTLTDYIRFNLKEEYGWRLDYPIKEFIKKLLKESAYKKGESMNVKTLSREQCDEVGQALDDKIEKYTDDIKSIIDDFNNSDAKAFCLAAVNSLADKISKDIDISPKDIRNKTINDILDEGKWYKGKKYPSSSYDVMGFITEILEKHSSLYILKNVKKNLYLYLMRGSLFNIINQHIDETNKVHISEFNKRISDIIAECSVPFIYERIGAKFKHFFIDEFQDTSVLQWFNFLPLIHNSLADGNKNFLVGDAKQSIYRFRNGEVEQINQLPRIYNKPLEKGVFDEYENVFNDQIEIKDLSVNYRTKKNIVYFNNSFFDFTGEMLTNKEHKTVYLSSMNQDYNKKKKGYEGCVNVKIYKNSEDDKKKDYEEAVMQSMVDDINSLREKNFKLSDITILVRYNSDGTRIAEYLSQNGIDVISSDSITLKSSDKVQLIIYTLKYMMNENNNIVKLNLSFYQGICNIDNPSCSIKETIDRYNNAKDINKEFLELRDYALSLYDLCSKIVKIYHFNVVEDVFLQYFMNMVYEWQNSENGGINAFLEHWDKKSDNMHVKITGKIDAVQIMTIHKSKGLEYKVVLYPYVPTKLPQKFRSTEKWLPVNNKEFPMLDGVPHIDDFMLPISGTLQYTTKSEYYDEEYGKIAFDDINAMYVAMTRAKDVLYIYSNDKTSKDKNDNMFLNYIPIMLSNEDKGLKTVDFVELEKDEESRFYEFQFGNVEYHNDKNETDDTKEIKLDENVNRNTIDWFHELKFDSDPIMFWNDNDNTDAQEKGILVHEILSKITTLEDADKVLQHYVNNGTISEKQSKVLLEQFHEIVKHPDVKDAYSDKAIVKNEMEILNSNGDRKRPDRFALLGDRAILIDYKTGKHDEKNVKDMQEYIIALQEISGNRNIEAYLIYIGEKIDVEPVFLDRLF